MALWEWDEERLCQRCPSCPVCIPETEGMLSVCCLCPGVCLCDSDRTALLSPLTLLSWGCVLQALLSPGGVCVPLLAALLQLCAAPAVWLGRVCCSGLAQPFLCSSGAGTALPAASPSPVPGCLLCWACSGFPIPWAGLVQSLSGGQIAISSSRIFWDFNFPGSAGGDGIVLPAVTDRAVREFCAAQLLVLFPPLYSHS